MNGNLSTPLYPMNRCLSAANRNSAPTHTRVFLVSAFKGYSHLQKALTYAWRSCQTLDVSALEEVKPMPPVCLDEVVADMPNLLAIRCKTNRKRLRNTIRPSIICT